jgi:thiamine-monophosphate kinase
VTEDGRWLQAVLGGGDDYELLFTAPQGADSAVAALASEAGVPVTAIGRIEAGQGVTVLDRAGMPMAIAVPGYRHF